MREEPGSTVRYGVAVGFVSAVAIPASLILTFLGINASQVHPDLSMFSRHYLGMYLTVATVIVLAVMLAAGFWLVQRRDARHHRVTGGQPRWTIAPEELDT